MNVWGVPDWLEKEMMERDKQCVYCGIEMTEKMRPHGPRKAVATWEHIVNDARIVNRENIARCCAACNSSKGAKNLSDWLESRYCMTRRINKDTVSEVVKKVLLPERGRRGARSTPRRKSSRQHQQSTWRVLLVQSS